MLYLIHFSPIDEAAQPNTFIDSIKEINKTIKRIEQFKTYPGRIVYKSESISEQLASILEKLYERFTTRTVLKLFIQDLDIELINRIKPQTIIIRDSFETIKDNISIIEDSSRQFHTILQIGIDNKDNSQNIIEFLKCRKLVDFKLLPRSKDQQTMDKIVAIYKALDVLQPPELAVDDIQEVSYFLDEFGKFNDSIRTTKKGKALSTKSKFSKEDQEDNEYYEFMRRTAQQLQ